MRLKLSEGAKQAKATSTPDAAAETPPAEIAKVKVLPLKAEPPSVAAQARNVLDAINKLRDGYA